MDKITLREGELHITLSSPVDNQVVHFDHEEVKLVKFDPGNCLVTIILEDNKEIELTDIDIIAYKILLSLALDSAFPYELV